MNIAKHLQTEHLHHAYIIEGDVHTSEAIKKHLQQHISGGELNIRTYDTFGIDESRELARLARMRSIGTQFFIYTIRTATKEAQNALLKLFEEPPERTHFFWCVPSAGAIIDTLRSRSEVIHREDETADVTLAQSFMTLSAAKRLKVLEPIIKEKDIAAANALMCGIVQLLQTTHMHHTHPQESAYAMEVQSILHDKGASLKILLESVALILPQSHI